MLSPRKPWLLRRLRLVAARERLVAAKMATRPVGMPDIEKAVVETPETPETLEASPSV